MDILIAVVAQYAVFLIPAGAALVWWRAARGEKTSMVVAGVITFGLTLIAIALAAHVWTDPRPFTVDGQTPLVAHLPDNGFPSDHMTIGTAVAATVLGWRRRLGALLLGVAVVVGAARVAAHIHHVPDIVAGLLIGLACAAAGVWTAGGPSPTSASASAARRLPLTWTGSSTERQ